ncbi:MAG TPA: LapA family protein [Caldisericia bacterium]|nr:LapA family protein [Caldisericia bacterium]HOL83394.1 LapA family protein [Caldisericia bacterium]HPC57121.1 LapA family protein [Caldisericia bacterium]HPP44026.1 LapA family protein [Caldisericia bacterium]HRT37135.1 LapA family protein [Caldisericia bacterium]
MIRTVIYLILFILAIVFLFQNGGQPVTLKFLSWETPSPIPAGFVFIIALLIGAVIVWLYHLPQIITLKNKLKGLDRKITLLMEDIKRKENELNEIKKTKEDLEKKLSEKKEEIQEGKKTEEVKEEEKEVESKKSSIFDFLKRKKENE